MVAQQLQQPAQATADATGAATFTFPSVPQGLAWLGSVAIPGAPYVATFVAMIGLDYWCSWAGPVFSGQIRIDSNVALKVTATNLTPGVQYNATLLGSSDNADVVGPAMATPSPPTSNAFATAPFVSTATTAAVFQSGFIPCSNVAGARYFFENHSTAAAVLVTLAWFTSTTSPPIGLRRVAVPAAVGAQPGLATFTHPHLGDLLVLGAAPLGGPGPLDLVVSASHHDSELTIFSDVFFSNGSVDLPDVLIWAEVSTATTATVASVTSFAGLCGYYVESGAATWAATLQALDAEGSWADLYEWDETTGSNIAQRIQGTIVVPPVPLQIILTNVTGGSPHSLSFTLTADSWR